MIICAALLVQFESLKTPTIIHCRRHGDGYETIRDLCYISNTRYSSIKEGFVDHNNNFLDRYDAFCHAKECGQLSQTTLWHKEDNRESELYSEDLY